MFNLRQIFAIKVVNKIAPSAAQLAKCILLPAYTCATAALRCASANKNFIYSLLTWSKQKWFFGGLAFFQPIRAFWKLFGLLRLAR